MLELDILENRLDDEVTGSKIGHVLGCDDAAQDRISLFGCPAFPCDLLVQNPLTIGLALLGGVDGDILQDDLDARGSSRVSRSEEHTSELQSLMRNSYSAF